MLNINLLWTKICNIKEYVQLSALVLILLPITAPIVQASQNKEKIPDVFVSMGRKSDSERAVVVAKDTQKLFLYAFDLNGLCRKVSEFNCSTGKVPGIKTRSGDSKTPEGVYFVTKKHIKRELSPIYGTRAFPLDYPNFSDQSAGRTGNSIWIHGTNKPLKGRDSNGCIVLKNSDIDKLEEYITPGKTPVIIVDKISYTSVESNDKIKRRFMSFISGWNDSLEKGTYHQYLDFYDPEYLPDISWWPDWNKTRKHLKTSNTSLSIEIKNLLILMYADIFVVPLDQTIRCKNKNFYIGTRKLFITGMSGTFKIIGEKYQLAAKDQKSDEKNPFTAAYRNMKAMVFGEQEIITLINGWLEAWSSKNIKKYGDYYANDFRSQRGANLNAWLKHKRRLNHKYAYINVSQDKMVVKRSGKKAAVSFIQTYESSAYRAVGAKHLVLICEKGGWKIHREIWKKI